MKFLYILLPAVLCTVIACAQYGRVDKRTGEFNFETRLDSRPYMFYGYASPSSRSKKMILFSTYPLNIADNKLYKYPLGAYHETTGLKDGEKIIYTGHKNGFAEMKYVNAENKETKFYIRRGFVRL